MNRKRQYKPSINNAVFLANLSTISYNESSTKIHFRVLALVFETALLTKHIVGSVSALTMASFFDNLEITRREFILMVSSLVLYFLFTMSMILIVLHTTRKNYETQKKVEYLENLNEYTKNLEIV